MTEGDAASRPRAAVTLLLLAGAVAAAAWAYRIAAEPEPSMVVLPFADLSPNRDREYFSDGLTEELIFRLSAVPDLKVISRTSAMHYKGSGKPLRQIARELRVGHLLEGSVRQSGDSVRIAAQLVDARTDAPVWTQHYTYELRGIFRVQEEIARDVAQALEIELGDRTRRLLVKRGTNDPEAWELYRRGRFVWNLRTRTGHEQAVAFFEQAIARDSSYAAAYAGLADVHLTEYQLNFSRLPEAETYSRLKWAAERALALDDESADAHTSFAIALWWQQNWPGAARELRRAIDLNPGHAMARSWYSLLLRGMGRAAEARQESRRAAELDPFAVIPAYNDGWQCYIDRDYDCAIEQYRRAISTGNYPSAWRGLALALAHRGSGDSAVRAAQEALALAPQRVDFLADLAYVQARAGLEKEARETLRRAKIETWEGFNVARAHVALGEVDSAFAWFERSSWRWPHRATLSDPALDPMRTDHRLTALATRIAREMGLQ